MATRNGKVANLPNDIREQLNLRLLEGETGRELAAWLNALPAVQSVLGSQFNGSHALADGDCDLAKTGLSAQRLLNILTLRFGELLMRWDFSPDEGASNDVAFSVMAKKARILQGISRSLLAIHRIQSRSCDKKSHPSTSPATSRGNSEGHASPSPAPAEALALPMREKEASPAGSNPFARPTAVERKEASLPQILSGPIPPPGAPLRLPHTLLKTELDLSEMLKAA
jgi:hypothetical protein